jgi:murein tripeptide amidase MpaA
MYRTVAQLDSLTARLAAATPDICTRLPLPERSVQGRQIFALRLRAGTASVRPGVLLLGGTHSRELMNPDLLIELAVDLIASLQAGTDIVLGSRTWGAADIRRMLESVDLFLLPCSNPDGRTYVMTVDDMWRKNRRDNPGSSCDGVDLNRNVDILWGVTEGQTSCSPCTDIYCGPSVFSEPENRNVRHLLDTFPIDCFADVHSYSELVIFPWGHAPTQTTDPAQNFTTLPSGTCQPINRPGYQEFLAPAELQRFKDVSARVVAEIAAVRGSRYTPEPGLTLYPTTGTHSDYAYARHIADPALHKTDGYTIETGPWMGNAPDSFHPADPEPIKREVESGLLALIDSVTTNSAPLTLA